MIAAIYARKSTEQNGISEEGKSVTRQIEHATAYAAKKGWTVAEEHIYSDDGISGAEFVKRPGFIRLMNALTPRPGFQVLVMSEESRLGRESIQAAYVLKQILDAGVRVFFYLEDRERKLGSATDKVMLSITAFAGEFERESAQQRTYDAMRRKAEAGYVAGGCVFGYDNVEVAANGKRQHVLRQINPDEAATVRRIFELYASGKGLTRIAKALNAARLSPARAGRHGWAPSAIRAILYRPLYRGEVVWNVLEKYTSGGTKLRRRRLEREWLRKEIPELRIISPDLWKVVQDRLAKTHQAYARGTVNGRKGAFVTRPTLRDLDSKYLLSGLTRCVCGGPFGAVTRTRARLGHHFYGCYYYQKRGPTVCPNALLIQQALVDQPILERLAARLDDLPREKVIARILSLYRESQSSWQERHVTLQCDLAKAKASVQRLLDLLCRGGQGIEALLERLKEEEAKKKALQAELEQGDASPPPVKNLEAEIRQRLADTCGLLRKDLPITRQILRKLATEPILAEAMPDGNGKGVYRFTFKGSYASLLPPVVVPTYVVSPTGFEPVLQP